MVKQQKDLFGFFGKKSATTNTNAANAATVANAAAAAASSSTEYAAAAAASSTVTNTNTPTDTNTSEDEDEEHDLGPTIKLSVEELKQIDGDRDMATAVAATQLDGEVSAAASGELCDPDHTFAAALQEEYDSEDESELMSMPFQEWDYHYRSTEGRIKSIHVSTQDLSLLKSDPANYLQRHGAALGLLPGERVRASHGGVLTHRPLLWGSVDWSTQSLPPGKYFVTTMGRVLSVSVEAGVLNVHFHTRHRVGGVGGRDHTSFTTQQGEKKGVLLHVLILYTFVGSPPGTDDEGDHMNRNELFNILTNLRWTPSWVNQQNKGIPKHNTTGRKGVSLCTNKKSKYGKHGEQMWQAQMTIKGEKRSRRWYVSVHGMRGAKALAVQQREEWEAERDEMIEEELVRRNSKREGSKDKDSKENKKHRK